MAALGLGLALVSRQAYSGCLAITEVMSYASTNLGSMYVTNGPDFFELTNFGTNEISLDGYSFSDAQTDRVYAQPFLGLTIGAKESVIFCRFQVNNLVTNEATFREWWGDTNLPQGLQISFYPNPGFNRLLGDEVWLYDSADAVVDAVAFGDAVNGRTFTYSVETGLFGSLSVAGTNGAFQAVTAEDVGSPGWAPATVPLEFINQPVDQEVDACGEVTFSVLAGGMPPPTYQWFFKETPILGEEASSLVISNVSLEDAGAYHAEARSCLEVVRSQTAFLTVSTNPRPAIILTPPSDAAVFENQTAVFSVAARGYPCLNYQWYTNAGAHRMPLTNQTGPTLVVPDVQLGQNNTIYSVGVSNIHGFTNAAATLFVSTRPFLAFTEVEPYPDPDPACLNEVWVELTNFDRRPVDLFHYRLGDFPSFANVFTNTNHVVIRPGESIIFCRRLPSEAFRNWWGTDQLPPGLQIVTFDGFNLNPGGEQVYLWNSAATDPWDATASISFTHGLPSRTLECDPLQGLCLIDSQEGVRGALKAARCDDIGSPGYVESATPRFWLVAPAGDAIRVTWSAEAGKSYRLKYATRLNPDLAGADWQVLGDYMASQRSVTVSDSTAPNASQRFYIVEELP